MLQPETTFRMELKLTNQEQKLKLKTPSNDRITKKNNNRKEQKESPTINNFKQS